MNRHNYVYTGRISTGKIVTVSSDLKLLRRELKTFFLTYMDETPILSPTVQQQIGKEKENHADL